MAGSGAAAGAGKTFSKEASCYLPQAADPGADSVQRTRPKGEKTHRPTEKSRLKAPALHAKSGVSGPALTATSGAPVSAKPKPGKSALIWNGETAERGRDGFLMLCIKKPHKRYKAYDDVPDTVKIDVFGFRFGRENGCKKPSGSLARPITSRSKSRLAALSKRKDTQSGVFPFQKG